MEALTAKLCPFPLYTAHLAYNYAISNAEWSDEGESKSP